MTDAYYDRPSWFRTRIVNPALRVLVLRAGLGRRGEQNVMRVLRVRGRSSGRSYEVPVRIAIWKGERHIVSVQGESQWARNLRAAGAAELLVGSSRAKCDFAPRARAVRRSDRWSDTMTMRSTLTSRLRPRARHAYLATRNAASRALIERRAGVETVGEVNLEDLGLDATNRVRYEPSGWKDLSRILRTGDVTDQDVFIDFGAGKGRVLLQAARYPFRRVIGVELSPALAELAQTNVDVPQAGRRCADVSVVASDVLAYDIPADLTYAYLYNPFRGEVFHQFIARLIESVDRHPRRVRVIYKTPMESERLEATGRFKLIRSVRGLRPGRAWAEKMSIRLYEIT